MSDLKPLIFVLCRLTALFLLCRGRSRKPSSETKMPLRGSFAHAFSALGFCGLVLPKYTPAPRSENHLFSYTLLDGWLYLVIAQGRTLLLCNAYAAPDFTTAEYFIFLAMKKLQLNPEMSTVYFRTPLAEDDEMSLYRYFKSVEQI